MSRPLALPFAALVGAVACVVSVVGLLRPGASVVSDVPVAAPAGRVSAAPAASASSADAVSPVAAVSILRAWDARRAAAWARDDPAALSALYVPGSPAGAHDAAMLGAWRARGLRVAGLATQLLSVEQLGRSATRWRLRVTDRVVGGTAVGGSVDRPLPADRPSTRTVVLHRYAGSWRVASVTTVGSSTGR